MEQFSSSIFGILEIKTELTQIDRRNILNYYIVNKFIFIKKVRSIFDLS